MNFSTYKVITYIGLVLFVPFIFGSFYLISQDTGMAILATLFLTALVIPLQFWQLSRLQDRLDDYDGSIPRGWAFDWDLVDDGEDDALFFKGDATNYNATQVCPNCGHLTSDIDATFCSRCGSRVGVRVPTLRASDGGGHVPPTGVNQAVGKYAERPFIACSSCGNIQAVSDGVYCKACGAPLYHDRPGESSPGSPKST